MRIDMLLKKRFLVHVLMLVCAVGAFAQPNYNTEWAYAENGKGVKTGDFRYAYGADSVTQYRYHHYHNITKPEQLAWIFNSEDKHVDDENIGPGDLGNIFIHIDADLDMQRFYWVGKGSANRRYYIDGQGHTIKIFILQAWEIQEIMYIMDSLARLKKLSSIILILSLVVF